MTLNQIELEELKRGLKNLKDEALTDLINSWINGNRSEVRKEIKGKSSLFVVDLIPVLVGQYGYKYHNAIAEVRKMLEV